MGGCYGDMLKLARQQLINTPTDWCAPVWMELGHLLKHLE